MKTLATLTLTRRGSERGSTFLIVLSILSLLVIAAATLTYTAGLEIQAAGNFAQATQARMAALTGLPAGAAAISSRGSLAVSANQRWANPAVASSRKLAQANAQTEARRLQTSQIAAASEDAASQPASAPSLDWMHVSQAIVALEDQGGRLSLNSLSAEPRQRGAEAPAPARFDREDLRDLLQRVKEDKGLEGLDPERLSAAIVAKIFGADGRPEGLDPLRELSLLAASQPLLASSTARSSRAQLLEADPRRTAGGDDAPFISLSQLFGMDGMPQESKASHTAFQALSEVLTVYSQSLLRFDLDGKSHDAIDPNTAPPQDIFDALRAAYPGLPPAQLAQWSVNVVDWRDTDRIPSSFPGSEESTPILGIEATPYIYEVWPDSITDADNGDDGQYFELVNPFDVNLSVDGWTVQIGQSGARSRLRGLIPAGGLLVVTDDLDESTDATPEDDVTQFGCFFDIFGEVGDGNMRRVMVDPDLELPDSGGILYLRDGEGNPIDYFKYTGMHNEGARFSAQRGDPRIRSCFVGPCTPLARNSNDSSTAAEFRAAIRDRALPSPVTLFRVFSGWAPAAFAAGDKLRGGYPALTAESAGLDARLLDMFTLTDPVDHGLRRMEVAMKGVRPPEGDVAATLGRAVGRRAALGALPADIDKAIRIAPLDPPTTGGLRVDGRLNINTAPRATLMALPGMTEDLAGRILEWRGAGDSDKDGSAAGALSGENAPAPFPSLSAFALNPSIWQGMAPEQVLGALSNFANLITTTSQVFVLEAQNQTPAESGDARPSICRIRSLILIEVDGRATALNWRIVTD